jgi:hypothetical protein
VIGTEAGACRRHQTALLDFVGTGERDAATGAALDHLDCCADCRVRMADVALAIAALRRFGAELKAVEPASDGWTRLRARVTRPHPAPWRWPLTVASTVTSTLLVAILVTPFPLHGPVPGELTLTVPPQGLAPQDLPDWRRETAYVAASRQGTTPATETTPSVKAGGPGIGAASALPRSYPDGVKPDRKEVEPEKPNGGHVPTAS